MTPIVRELFPIRLISINRAIYHDPKELRVFADISRPFFNTQFSKYERIDFPVVIVITAYFNSKKYAIDADNLFIKPIIDSLAQFVLMNKQDGFEEVHEVRTRTRVNTQSRVVVEVYRSPHEL